MGALLTEYQATIPEERRQDLSNPGKPNASSVNTTIEAKAETHAKSYFELWSRQSFDETITGHIVFGIRCMIYAQVCLDTSKASIVAPMRKQIKEDMKDLKDMQWKEASATSAENVVDSDPLSQTSPDFTDAAFDGYQAGNSNAQSTDSL